MITDLLKLTRPLVILDTETTGVDTTNDRIVELAFQVYYHDGRDVKEYRTLINPGVPIPAETTEVHGITDAMVKVCRKCGKPRDRHEPAQSPIFTEESTRWICDSNAAEMTDYAPWPTFKQLAPNLKLGFTNVDFCGKNVRFDLRILSAEFARAGVEWSIGDARIVDADRLEALLVPRSLSHLHQKYLYKPLEGAHGAMADVKGVADVIEQQLLTSQGKTVQAYAQVLPLDLDALHALQWQQMIDLEGKFAFDKAGMPCFTRWGKYAGKPMTAADNGYWDFIIRSTFAVETKAIAGRAKLGQFPRRKA